MRRPKLDRISDKDGDVRSPRSEGRQHRRPEEGAEPGERVAEAVLVVMVPRGPLGDAEVELDEHEEDVLPELLVPPPPPLHARSMNSLSVSSSGRRPSLKRVKAVGPELRPGLPGRLAGRVLAVSVAANVLAKSSLMAGVLNLNEPPVAAGTATLDRAPDKRGASLTLTQSSVTVGPPAAAPPPPSSSSSSYSSSNAAATAAAGAAAEADDADDAPPLPPLSPEPPAPPTADDDEDAPPPPPLAPIAEDEGAAAAASRVEEDEEDDDDEALPPLPWSATTVTSTDADAPDAAAGDSRLVLLAATLPDMPASQESRSLRKGSSVSRGTKGGGGTSPLGIVKGPQ